MDAHPLNAPMRVLIPGMLLVAAVIGCAHRKHPAPYSNSQSPVLNSSGSSNRASGLIVTPENLLIGKVAMVNAAGRFVVINFPLGRMPLLEQHLNLYRRGLK